MNNVIMIVDDERHILNTCKRLLIDEPFNCVFFESPVEALQKLEQILPAVIISRNHGSQDDA